MLAVNGVGKPCAGEPHARIDGRELETEHESTKATEMNHLRETSGTTAPAPTADLCHRASSRPSSRPWTCATSSSSSGSGWTHGGRPVGDKSRPSVIFGAGRQ